jgi:hypothetical protein
MLHVDGYAFEAAGFATGADMLNIVSTPSMLVKEVVLDKVWIKHWEYKS